MLGRVPPVVRRLAALCAAGALASACVGGPDGPVVLLGGDVHGESPIAEALSAGRAPLNGLAEDLDDADVVIVNLETPVGPPGTSADKDIIFRADEALLEGVAAAGVDVVNLANNHALDQGPDVLEETISAAQRHGLEVVGAGADAEAAWAPALLEVGGEIVAVLGMSDVVPSPAWEAGDGPGIASALDHDRAEAAVRDAAGRADHVVVTVHWGNEFRECPSIVQTALAHRLIAAGADVVAGHHPHVVQGLEQRGDAVIAYSLGNLVFYAATEDTREAALLRVELGDQPAHELLPVVLDSDGLPRTAAEAAAERILERIRQRSPGGGTCPAAVWEGLPERSGG